MAGAGEKPSKKPAKPSKKGEKPAEAKEKSTLDENAIWFEHKFFASFENMYFRLSETNEPVAVVKMGVNEAVLGFEGIRREFALKPDSHDSVLLDRIAEGLQFVRGLQMGQMLPKEITTREASWEPSERHVRIARQRLTMQLVTWLTGDEHIFTSSEELMQLAEDPQMKRNINLAFTEAAEALGIGRERREEVVMFIETLAKELAYIEAERDVFVEIKKIDDKIQGLRRIYSAERSLLETVDQVARLSQRSLRVLNDMFEEVDAQTGEIIGALKNIENQTEYIRKMRDDLFRRLMPWEEIIPSWRSVYVVRSDNNIVALRDIYQFLAPRYMQVNEWVLVTKAGFFDRGKKKSLGGVMRW